jgi:CHAT domain-containing protein
MAYKNVCYSAVGDRKRQVIYQNLTNYLILFFLSNLLPLKSLPQALGCIPGPLRLPAQEAAPEAAQRATQGTTQERGGTSDEKNVRSLEPGQPIERGLASGQEHIYRIKLGADQFLKAVVEQQKIDLAVQVLRPDGKRIFRFDSESRLQGQEEVSLVAEAAGDYRLVVQPTQTVASAGGYQIRIEGVRLATENDRALHEARKLFDEARRLRDDDKYNQALPLFERVIETHQRILGPDHSELANTIHNLAVLHYYQGDYLKVEPLSNRALAIQEKALGREHPDVAASLNLLANLYFHRGDYLKAEPLYNRALAIRQKAVGPEHPSLAYYLRNLARLHFERGDYVKAELLYQRALAIREKTLEPESRFVAISINDLANLHYNRGDDAKAEQLHRRALAIQEKVLGQEHPNVADSLRNLANIYRDRKDYLRAEPLYLRALAIQEKTLGPQRPHVARTLNNLAAFYAAKGDIAQALEFQSRASDVTEYNLYLNIAAGSERQKLAFLALLSRRTDFTLSLHSQAASDDPRALNLAFTTLLRRKGRGLDAMANTIATLRRHATPQDQGLFDQLAETRSQLAKLTLTEVSEVTSETYRSTIKSLEEKIERLEAELSNRSAEFRAQAQPVTLSAIQAALPANTILIEFVVYTPRDLLTGKSRPPRYLAYLLAARGQPKWADLGEAAPINRAIDAWRRALRNRRRTDVKRLARAVDEKIMRPVRSSIQSLRGDASGEIGRLLIVPDGSLNLIPFAALVDEQRRYLVERYTISYLTSGRDLLRLPTASPRSSAPLIVASPAFGKYLASVVRADQTTGKGSAGNQAARPIDPAPIFFQPLPGTEDEALAIKTVLPEAVVLLGKEATEAALKQAQAPRILHIATHGFFFDDREPSPEEARNLVSNNLLDAPDRLIRAWAAQVENPLLRSGLALAGANQGKSGDDDGVLTALEAAGLDLSGTKLVVLSACDTGVGEVRNGEGVQGLRRALVLAGSESQVMSLWAVSDEATKDLMIPYYKALQEGEERSEGLRRVQLRTLRGRRSRQHPFYWAAFIQSGEWANLDGKR